MLASYRGNPVAHHFSEPRLRIRVALCTDLVHAALSIEEASAMESFQVSDLPTLHRMQDAARRIAAMVHRRAIREYGLAFGSTDCDQLNWCVIHNSLVARSEGKPWREVDYSHMRKAAWLLDQQHAGSALVDAWYRRKCGID
jgi:hypothetical protein